MSFATFIHDAELKALGITKSVWAFLYPLIINGFNEAVANVLPIVEPIVIGLASDPTRSGADKASHALNAAIPALEAAGISAGINVIKTAIEVSVAKLPKPGTITSQAGASSVNTPKPTPAITVVS